MFSVIDNNNKLEMQMGKLNKRKCIYNSISKCLCISFMTEFDEFMSQILVSQLLSALFLGG